MFTMLAGLTAARLMRHPLIARILQPNHFIM
jgi:hypothetical protein